MLDQSLTDRVDALSNEDLHLLQAYVSKAFAKTYTGNLFTKGTLVRVECSPKSKYYHHVGKIIRQTKNPAKVAIEYPDCTGLIVPKSMLTIITED